MYGFAGDKDAVGLFGKGFLQFISIWKAAGALDISYKLYEGVRHEMLHEINRQEVLNDLLRWLNNHNNNIALLHFLLIFTIKITKPF